MQTSTLRPGLLVSLKTSIVGNVSYRTSDIEAARVDENGEQHSRWETEKTVIDPAEHERATKARGKARSAVSRVCANSAFGLLCPESEADKLEAAIAEARQIADEFNASAQVTRIAIYVIAGRVASDDVEAVRAINSEVKDLLDQMQRGVQDLEPSQIRDAANKARSVSQMLSKDAQDRVADAIEAARKAARQIVKAGEAAAIEVDQMALRKLAQARTAFLDLSEQTAVETPQVEVPTVDLEPAEMHQPVEEPQINLDFGE